MASERRSRILALDGGGVRGWSQILLLGNIIHQIKAEEEEDKGTLPEETELYPCDYFDLIFGSGTGGINAILIGRLGMSIGQMKLAYKRLKEEVFDHIAAKTYNDPLFDELRLEKWAKDLVKEHTGHENSKLIPDKAPENEEDGNKKRRGCKIAVTSMLKNNLGRAELLRSYRVRSSSDTTCTIWEAIRATTAFPLFFKHISIGNSRFNKKGYTGGDLLQSNPIKLLVDERNDLYNTPDAMPAPHGCIVSLGTGKREAISLAGYQIGDPKAEEMLFDALTKMATGCEKAHQDFGSSIPLGMEGIYYRFNVEQGLQNIADSDWKSDTVVVSHALQHINHEEYAPQFEELKNLVLKLKSEDDEREDYRRRLGLKRSQA